MMDKDIEIGGVEFRIGKYCTISWGKEYNTYKHYFGFAQAYPWYKWHCIWK